MVSSLDYFKAMPVSLGCNLRVGFTMASSEAEEVFWVREEGLGSFWENLGLILVADCLPIFYFS